MILRCRDLGEHCDFEVRGNCTAEIKRAMLRHTERRHLDAVVWMTPREIRAMETKMDQQLAVQHHPPS
jgi:predicted small metal-binding protein